MTFPQKNASTIFAMPDMGPPNQDTLYLWRAVDAEGEVLDVLVRLGGTNGRRLN